MSRYVQYQTENGGIVLVEVEDGEEDIQSGVVRAGRLGDKLQDTVVETQTRFEDAMDTVHHSAQTIIKKIRGLSDPPDEVEVIFGLKAVGEFGNLAVAKAGVEANYTVKLIWKREQKTADKR